MDAPSSRVTWLLVGVAYGTVLGIMLGRRLRDFQLSVETLRARVWDLEANERARAMEARKGQEAPQP